ncbi:Homoserine/homoserine lactone efflux protein [Defluviimonas aquaemixtae]|uniref:Homoserine/homoserine lactone efflux protein n=1 Tax=Albidovulum aquaemixtae TaxID=1542388 RepID=A0A2R8BL28_9RHOB|nr:LysE family translocator [Defluviimonas aquaemixtae]SPH24142.1 Homoserine/homoserine lactone efflux protein [Defluviimonas aquaemixtae]
MWDIVQTYPGGQLLAFVLAGLALNFTPGADVLFATASGLRGGPRAGMAAGLGVGLGGVLHVSLAALGLAALVAAHPAALTAIRWAGAGYLLWLAWSVWHAGPPEPGARGAADPGRALARGFLANALNPKVIVFILAFLPQFTDPAFGPIWAQIVFLGAIFTVTGTIVTMGYGALAGAMGRSLRRTSGIMNRIAAAIFAGLAVRLVWE